MGKAAGGMTRVERVALLVKEELARLINEGLKDPRVGMVTVTDVVLSQDLREGVVYVSVYGDEHTQKNTLQGLTAAAPFLRHELSTILTIRHIPSLVFKIDDSLERGLKMDRLLHQIATGAAIEDIDAEPAEPTEFVAVETLHDVTPIEQMPDLPTKKAPGRRHAGNRPRHAGNGQRKRTSGRR